METRVVFIENRLLQKIFRKILHVAKVYENDMLFVTASQIVVDRLLDEGSTSLAELQKLVGETVKFGEEAMYTQEEFNVVLS